MFRSASIRTRTRSLSNCDTMPWKYSCQRSISSVGCKSLPTHELTHAIQVSTRTQTGTGNVCMNQGIHLQPPASCPISSVGGSNTCRSDISVIVCWQLSKTSCPHLCTTTTAVTALKSIKNSSNSWKWISSSNAACYHLESWSQLPACVTHATGHWYAGIVCTLPAHVINSLCYLHKASMPAWYGISQMYYYVNSGPLMDTSKLQCWLSVAFNVFIIDAQSDPFDRYFVTVETVDRSLWMLLSCVDWKISSIKMLQRN